METQYGFKGRRSPADATFGLLNLLEKFREKRQQVGMVFVDLEKAFAHVPRCL